MSDKEQAWAELRAGMVLKPQPSWEGAITQHTEREYFATRETRRLQGRTRNGGWRKSEIKRRTK